MAIEWTTITWYSRLAAIIFFVGILPVLNFYIGVKYQQTTAALQESVSAQQPLPQCPLPVKVSDAKTASSTPDERK